MGFEETLQKLRKERNMSLREAAAEIGISHTYLAALEKGRDPRTGNPIVPSQQILINICNLYGIEYTKAFTYFSLYKEQDIYDFMGHQLNVLRKTDPKRFKDVLEIIYSD